MTIGINTTAVTECLGDDTSSLFPVVFPTYEVETIEAEVLDPNDITTPLVRGVDFSLAGVGKGSTSSTLTLIDSAQAWLTAGTLKTGWTLYIKFAATGFQPMKGRDIIGPFAPAKIEQTLDRLSMSILAVKALTGMLSNEASGAVAAAQAAQLAAYNSQIAAQQAAQAALGDSTIDPLSKNANFTAVLGETYVTLGALSIQLPPLADRKPIRIKKLDSNIVALIRNGAEEIDGVAADRVLTSAKESVLVVNNGTNWFII